MVYENLGGIPPRVISSDTYFFYGTFPMKNSRKRGLFIQGWHPMTLDSKRLRSFGALWGAMSRHSKHSNDRMFFTAKERADAGYSKTRKDRWEKTMGGL